MSEKNEKSYLIRVDEDTHTDLKVMAAKKKTTIGKLVKKLKDEKTETDDAT